MNSDRFHQLARRWTSPILWLGTALLAVATLLPGLQGPVGEKAGLAAPLFTAAGAMALIGWIAVALGSFGQFRHGNMLAGHLAREAAVPGAVCAAMAIVSGAALAQSTGAGWWIWGTRQGAMLVLLFLYIGYFALVRACGRLSLIPAIFGVLAAATVPLILASLWWWGARAKGAFAASDMSLQSAMFALGLLLVAVAVIFMRMRAALAEMRIEAAMHRLAER